MAVYSDILKHIPLVNISETSGMPYQSLVNALQASTLSKYGYPMPLDAVKKFQGNCKAWDQELRTLFEEFAVVQRGFMDLAKEIGIHHGGNASNATDGESVDMESDLEFGEMIKEVKQIRKTWTTRMQKLENVCSSFLTHVRTLVHAPSIEYLIYLYNFGSQRSLNSCLLLHSNSVLANLPRRVSPEYVDDAGNLKILKL